MVTDPEKNVHLTETQLMAIGYHKSDREASDCLSVITWLGYGSLIGYQTEIDIPQK